MHQQPTQAPFLPNRAAKPAQRDGVSGSGVSCFAGKCRGNNGQNQLQKNLFRDTSGRTRRGKIFSGPFPAKCGLEKSFSGHCAKKTGRKILFRDTFGETKPGKIFFASLSAGTRSKNFWNEHVSTANSLKINPVRETGQCPDKNGQPRLRPTTGAPCTHGRSSDDFVSLQTFRHN